MSYLGHLYYGLRHGVQSAGDRWKNTRRWRQFAAEHPLGATECGLITCEGIGDHWLVCALVPAIEIYHGLHVKVVAGNARFSFLQELFPGIHYAATPAGLPEESGHSRLTAGCYFFTHFPAGGLMHAIGYGDFHLLDAYRCRLALPPEANLAIPALPTTSALERARDVLRQNGLPEKETILLCPNARSTPTGDIDSAFWIEIAKQLRARGRFPIINGGPGTSALPGIPSVSLPLADFRAFVLLAGGVCMVRSGLAELISDLPCRRVVIYPDVRYWAGHLLPSTTLTRYSISAPPHEVLVKNAHHAAAVRSTITALTE